jgi:DNA adenine methylase
MEFTSPLRYPGGKGKLTNFVKLLIEENNLYDGHYAEPYAGGAGIALNLLFQEYISQIHINDINPSIYSFWFSVLNHTEDLCRLINDTTVNISNWKKQKNIQKKKSEVSNIELGFSTFFLNRSNRSGILTGGAIGGIKQKGNYKIDARFNKKELIKRIEKIAFFSDRIKLYDLDADIFIRKILPKLPSKMLVYFDPPYFIKGKELYENHYATHDHVTISKSITKIEKQYWIVSYDSVNDIKILYNQYRSIEYFLNYCAGKNIKGKEIIFFDNRLIIPDVYNLANIKVA